MSDELTAEFLREYVERVNRVPYNYMPRHVVPPSWFVDTLPQSLPVEEKNPTIISAEEILEGLDK